MPQSTGSRRRAADGLPPPGRGRAPAARPWTAAARCRCSFASLLARADQSTPRRRAAAGCGRHSGSRLPQSTEASRLARSASRVVTPSTRERRIAVPDWTWFRPRRPPGFSHSGVALRFPPHALHSPCHA
ncbi:MAG: hypothetical protein NTW21_29275 [Verrucomicrobia bacterium]|nr:hypothetical protein [Verrucomicrobiota bacterium]